MIVAPSPTTARALRAALYRLAPVLVAALALALRLYRIDAQSLWFDEGWSVHLAREPIAAALRQIASEGHTHPPGYYLLLMGWTRLWGDSVAAVRALSALTGALTVYLVYLAGRTLCDHPTGLLAAALLAVSPAHWLYSQEARMYALLSASFAGLLPLVYRYVRAQEGWRRRDWAALVGLEILACYTHLFAAFVLAGLAAWLIAAVLLGPRGGWRALLPWLASQAAVGLAFLPWLGPALARAGEHAALGAEAPGAAEFAMDTWAFLMGGHIALVGREPFFALAARAAMVLLGLVAVWLVWARGRRSAAVYLLVQAGVPCALVFLLMQARPGYHPRYSLVSLVPLVLIMAAGVIASLRRGGWRPALAILAAAAWLGAGGLAGHALANDRYYDRDDARGAAAYLDAHLPPDGAILMDVDDWALRYYLETAGREAQFVDAGRPPDDVTAGCAAALEGRSAAALVTWYAGRTDHRDLLPYLLERRGAEMARDQIGGYTVRRYALTDDVDDAVAVAPEVDLGSLRLVRAAVDATTPADEGVPVALTWRALEDLDDEYKASLRLVDAGGHVVAQADWFLQSREGASTDAWTVGREVTNYAVLAIPPGTPPARYDLEVSVYAEDDPEGLDVLDAAGNPAGKAYALPPVELTPIGAPPVASPDWSALGLQPIDPPHRAAPGLEVLAHTPVADRVDTGLTLEVRVSWRTTASDLPAYVPALRLVRDGRTLAEAPMAPAYGAHPTSRWLPGEVVLDWRDLVVPADLAPGPAELQLVIADGEPLRLGEVFIEAVPHIFEAPTPAVAAAMPLGRIAELVGYDPPPAEVHPPEGVPLTLYWRAHATAAKAYVAFTHLLGADGRLVAQHDGPPAGGERPTTGWAAGEYVTDAHVLEWVDPEYRGPLTIEVGLYDPATGERLLTPEGDSRLFLPAAIMAR